MRHLCALAIATLLAFAAVTVPALAPTADAAELKVATVDFQRALDEVNEGKAVKSRLEAKFKEKQKAIADMEKRLGALQEEIQAQAAILSQAALQAKADEFQQLQMQYQQTYMASEQEMQGMYAQEMEGLIKKMRTICEEIARERGHDLVVEAQEGGVVFSKTELDITAELIKRYNARHAG